MFCNIINQLRQIKRILRKRYNFYFNSIIIRIIKKPEEEFPVVFHIKDDTYEKKVVEETYKINRAYNTLFFHQHQDILLVNQAYLIDGSDIVRTNKGVVWDKALQENFSTIVPLDSDLLTYTHETVKVRKIGKLKKISGICISLLGVHASVWAHFIVQFLPKLFFAADGNLLNSETTILVPDYKDSHINIIIQQIINKTGAKIVKAQKGFSYLCQYLYYIPSASYLGNHSNYISTCQVVLPQSTLQTLRKNLVEPLVSMVKNRKVENKKVYLVRRNSSRSLTNWQEIESFFENEGFCFVEPHKMNLIDKVSVFYHADLLVGPFSSAWSNAIFCNGSKGLLLTNFQRLEDTYQVGLGHLGNITYLQVTGWDFKPEPNTDYYIPLDKVISAYNRLLSM